MPVWEVRFARCYRGNTGVHSGCAVFFQNADAFFKSSASCENVIDEQQFLVTNVTIIDRKRISNISLAFFIGQTRLGACILDSFEHVFLLNSCFLTYDAREQGGLIIAATQSLPPIQWDRDKCVGVREGMITSYDTCHGAPHQVCEPGLSMVFELMDQLVRWRNEKHPGAAVVDGIIFSALKTQVSFSYWPSTARAKRRVSGWEIFKTIITDQTFFDFRVAEETNLR
jgi:hypothetical protein